MMDFYQAEVEGAARERAAARAGRLRPAARRRQALGLLRWLLMQPLMMETDSVGWAMQLSLFQREPQQASIVGCICLLQPVRVCHCVCVRVTVCANE